MLVKSGSAREKLLQFQITMYYYILHGTLYQQVTHLCDIVTVCKIISLT